MTFNSFYFTRLLSTLQDLSSPWLSFTSFFSLLETSANLPKICSGLDRGSFFSLPSWEQTCSLRVLDSLVQAELISHELLLSIFWLQCPFVYVKDLLIVFVVERRQGLIQVQKLLRRHCQLQSFSLLASGKPCRNLYPVELVNATYYHR